MRQLSDAQALSRLSELLTWLAKRIWEAGSDYSGAFRPFREFRTTIESEHFRARARLLPDYACDEARMLIQLRFSKAGQNSKRVDSIIYVRLNAGQKRLSHPVLWRRALGGLRGEDSVDHLGRDIYWSPSMPLEDPEIQLIIAMIQLRILPQDNPLGKRLYEYVAKFSVPTRNRVPRTECVHDCVVRILRNWSFPEDWRAWRKYISETLYWVSYEPEDSVSRFRRSKKWNGENDLTVPDAAEEIDCSPWYVHDLVEDHKLKARKVGGMILIDRKDVERVRSIFSERKKRKAIVRSLTDSGKSFEAARKAVLRKYGSAPKIPRFPSHQ